MALQMIVNNTVLPSGVLVEDSYEPTLEYGTKERKSYGGVSKRPNGRIETSEFKFEMYYDTPDDFEAIFAGAYNTPSGTQLIGNLTFTNDSCAVATGARFVVRDDCSTTDDDDYTWENATVVLNFSPKITVGEDKKVEVMVYAQPDNTGLTMTYGTLDLTQPSHLDPTDMTTKAVV